MGLKFTVEVDARMTLEVNPDGKASKVISVDTVLNVKAQQPIQKGFYHNADASPTYAGVRASTQTLVSALNSNIQYGHEKGYWDSAEHLRYAIAELEKQFVMVTGEAKMEDWDKDTLK